MDRLLTVRDVAEYLQMSKEKVYKLAQQGKFLFPELKTNGDLGLKINTWLKVNELGTISVFTESKPLEIVTKADPFLKWAGGKGQLLKQYEALFPEKFNNYFEPFVGGGAVFFYLYNTGNLNNDKKVILLDSNEELINCYLAIKENVNRLIAVLSGPKFVNKKEIYYKIRAEDPLDKFERAARTIYLNKTCFNGLYRVNSQGKFNVPFGGYRNPLICNTENLRAVNRVLQNVEILCGGFERSLEFVKRGDFIYFDPPYQPLSKTSSFTSYTRDSFGEKDQNSLCFVFKELDKIGCTVMLSNSDTSFIRKLYKDFRIEVVFAKRAINCKASGRGAISELVILNY